MLWLNLLLLRLVMLGLIFDGKSLKGRGGAGEEKKS